MLFDVIIHNVNAVSARADLDQCGDETTFGHNGFGEPGSGLWSRLTGKPGVTKGGQTVIVLDRSWMRPRAYSHRHKLHTPPNGFTSAQGPCEARRIAEMIKPMVEKEPQVQGVKKLFQDYPHFTWDNHFSGDQIMDWLGENGFSATMTCRRNRLPKDIPGMYWNKEITGVNDRSKAARFVHPITAVKVFKFPSTDAAKRKSYTRCHVSFQSTSSCNLSTVNALNVVKADIRKKNRGRGNNKRTWGIEMNDARDLYLGSYGKIDSLDHMIKNTALFYRSWKYWHSAMLHAKALACVVAYDMYLECCEGGLDPVWKMKPVDYWTFRDKLATGLLRYNPKNRKFPGDSKMRVATKQRSGYRSSPTESSSVPSQRVVEREDNVSYEQLQDALTDSNGSKARICGDLDLFTKHWNAMDMKKHGTNCAVCGIPAYSACSICGVTLHHPGSNRSKQNKPPKGANCFLDYHNKTFYGLAKCDCVLIPGQLAKRKANWEYPIKRVKKAQAKYINDLEMAGEPPVYEKGGSI